MSCPNAQSHTATDHIAEYDQPVSGAEGERTSLAYIQLEKHNERLKEALIRQVLPQKRRVCHG